MLHRAFFKLGLTPCRAEQQLRNEVTRKRRIKKLVENGLNVTDPLIFALIYIFLSRREKTHGNKEFSQKNSKRRRESRITTR